MIYAVLDRVLDHYAKQLTPEERLRALLFRPERGITKLSTTLLHIYEPNAADEPMMTREQERLLPWYRRVAGSLGAFLDAVSTAWAYRKAR